MLYPAAAIFDSYNTSNKVISKRYCIKSINYIILPGAWFLRSTHALRDDLAIFSLETLCTTSSSQLKICDLFVHRISISQLIH